MSDARAERRRRDREARRRAQPAVVVGDGMIAHAVGHHYHATSGAELPAKVAGRHRWVASAVYVLDDKAAATAFDDTARNLLGPANMMMLAAYCWDCEQVLAEQAAWASTCPAPADD